MTHLDTSFLVRALKPENAEAQQLATWVRDGEHLGISAPAWMEYLCGPVSQGQVQEVAKLLGEPHPLGEEEARLAARLFNESGRRRGSVVDCMIAATALQARAQLATSNITDFRRFEGLGLSLVVLR